MEMILVSACLLGVNCKYNGQNNANSKILKNLKNFGIVPICPEQLGGLATPRLPAEIQNGQGLDVLLQKAKVIRKDGVDVSEAFIKGAYETLFIAESMSITRAILKAKSPSCGLGQIYDGTYTNTLKAGDGVTTALLRSKGIRVSHEFNYSEDKPNSN